jgi:hypothetical protein
MDDISRAVERMATRYYRYLAQMMKVYYTEEHWFKYDGEDGQYDFVMMKSDLLEDGIDITVESGSTMPMNKDKQQEFASNLAKMGMIDPLTLYEVGAGMPMPSPRKMLERLLAYKTDPMAFAGMAAKDEFDSDALMDIQILNRGEVPKQRDDVSAEYLAFFNKYMTTGEYKRVVAGKPDIMQAYIKHLVSSQMIAQQQLDLMATQMPTPQEMDMQNQGAVQKAQQDKQIDAGGAPQGPVAPPPSPDGKPVTPPPPSTPGTPPVGQQPNLQQAPPKV